MRTSLLTILPFLHLACALSTFDPRLIPAKPPSKVDFIVVGGGTAGLSLATRLSEDPSVTVAVLEAGPDLHALSSVPLTLNRALVDVPAADVLGVGSSPGDSIQDAIDWGIITTPQAGANRRRIRYARGKVLGGSSNRNFMLYQRPSVGSMSIWQQLSNDSSWGFNERLNDFKRGITFNKADESARKDALPIPDDSASFAGGTTGALNVGYPTQPQAFSGSMEASMNEQGFKSATSFNNGSLNNAVQFSTLTVNPSKNGIRSTSRDFYGAVESRKNLFVYTNQQVSRIVFDSSASVNTTIPRAVGVETIGGHLGATTLYAKREVIVSAGAFHSPQLLMVSGIGPKDQLSRFNIPTVVLNEAVGKNMQDHIFAGPTFPVNVETLTGLASNPLYLTASLAKLLGKQGILTNNVADMIAFERLDHDTLVAIGASSLNDLPGDYPHIEYLSAPGVVKDFSNLLAENIEASTNGQQYATILAALVAPQSRGSVTLRSANMTDLPVVDPGWLTDPIDQAVAIEAFKRTRRIFAAKAMQKILTGPEYYPGPSVQSDKDILEFWKNNLMTVWHAATTCIMAPAEAGGVVDSQFRVYGVHGLRVVDASSFPQLAPGHPQSVLYMMANRAADLILGRH